MSASAIQEFSPAWLASVTQGRWLREPATPLRGFAFDARVLGPGEVFIALSCGSRDGHAFTGQARAAGAAAALVEHELPEDLPQLLVADSLAAMAAIGSACRRSFAGTVLGITGSSGKTSTKEMLRCLLDSGQVHATAGNWNNRIGVPMTLFGLHQSAAAFAVIEAGINQPGEMALLGQMIEADLCLLTNIGTAHLELLGSQEGIAEEKSKLAVFSRSCAPLILPAPALGYPPLQALAERVIALVGPGEAVPLGVRECVHYQRAEGTDPSQQAITLTRRGSSETFLLASGSAGMAQNAALALIAAEQLGVPPAERRERLAHWRPGATRGGLIESVRGPVYSDCYNANPDSMCDALATFARTTRASLPRCYVLAAMNELGSEAAVLHRACGRAVPLRPQDQVCLIGPPAMTAAYREGLLENSCSPSQITAAESITEVTSELARFEGALFLKGSRSYQLESLLPEDVTHAGD